MPIEYRPVPDDILHLPGIDYGKVGGGSFANQNCGPSEKFSWPLCRHTVSMTDYFWKYPQCLIDEVIISHDINT